MLALTHFSLWFPFLSSSWFSICGSIFKNLKKPKRLKCLTLLLLLAPLLSLGLLLLLLLDFCKPRRGVEFAFEFARFQHFKRQQRQRWRAIKNQTQLAWATTTDSRDSQTERKRKTERERGRVRHSLGVHSVFFLRVFRFVYTLGMAWNMKADADGDADWITRVKRPAKWQMRTTATKTTSTTTTVVTTVKTMVKWTRKPNKNGNKT